MTSRRRLEALRTLSEIGARMAQRQRETALDEAVRKYHWAWRTQDETGRQVAPPLSVVVDAAPYIRSEFRRIMVRCVRVIRIGVAVLGVGLLLVIAVLALSLPDPPPCAPGRVDAIVRLLNCPPAPR